MYSFLIYFFLSLCFFSPDLQAKEPVLPDFPKSAPSSEAFVPKNWQVLSMAEGDLNGDKLIDRAMVIQKKSKKSSSRLLVVIFQSKKDWSLALISSKVILDSNSGGKSGDPFSGINIRSGILQIEHQGGTGLLWKYIHRYQFRKDGFYMIGKSNQEIDLHSQKTLEVDTNLLTGKVTKRGTDMEGKSLPLKITTIKKEKLILLN